MAVDLTGCARRKPAKRRDAKEMSLKGKKLLFISK
jgi:hypothetical protein